MEYPISNLNIDAKPFIPKNNYKTLKKKSRLYLLNKCYTNGEFDINKFNQLWENNNYVNNVNNVNNINNVNLNESYIQHLNSFESYGGIIH